jgi:hypothetical protein
MNPVRKTPGSIDASVSGIVRTTQIDRTALPVKKPVATIVPNSNSNARQSNVAVVSSIIITILLSSAVKLFFLEKLACLKR